MDEARLVGGQYLGCFIQKFNAVGWMTGRKSAQ